jgi:hypothetical protein
VLACVRRRPLDLFLLLWVGVLLARLLVPGAANFDAVRHFLEIFPPLAALAGSVFGWYRWRPRPLSGGVLAGASGAGGGDAGRSAGGDAGGTRALVATLLAVLPGLLAIAHLHPFEDAYWNLLIGGLPGAHARKLPQSGEYWATSYRQGIEWLNRNAPQHAALAVPIAEQTVAIAAPVRLRKDIELVRYAPAVPPFDPQRLPHLVERAQHQPVFVMFIRRDEVGNELTRACIGGLRPVARWSRDGVPLMEIYSLAGVRLRRGR